MKIVGISDEVLTCDCCGKTDLKKTVVLQDDGGGEFYFYGQTCASKALTMQGKEIWKQAKEEEEKKKKRELQIKFQNHPLIKQVDEEIKQANENNISPGGKSKARIPCKMGRNEETSTN